MVDLFGLVPVGNNVAEAIQQPFVHLRGNEKIQVRESRLDVDSSRWWMLHRNDEEAACQDAGLVVLVHGNCYLREASADGRRLTPKQIVDQFRTKGERMIHDLKGSFAIVVADLRQKAVYVFTDPLNIRTIYYTTHAGNLLLSTSLTAIANGMMQLGTRVQPDRRAMLDLYLFDFTLDDRTFLKGVRELGAGSVLLAKDGKVSVSQWFDPFQEFNLRGKVLSRKDGAALVRDVLSQNVQLYNEGPAKTAIALTGGFDSRSILALLQGPINESTFFSYGLRQSWDVSIPQKIAERMKLKYVPIFLEDEYQSSFPAYSNLAVLLSDGAAEFSHANIPYVYSNFLTDKSSILTGLFGSELIKTPSSRGLFLDTNSIALLTSNDPASTMQAIFKEMSDSRVNLPFSDKETQEEVIEMVRRHPYISNTLPSNEKFFYYLLMVGVRKYFRKETKIQRFWKDNLHPFFDIGFISRLLETPFPWVYNFSQEKSLVRNIRIHKLYGSIINENPVLSKIVSTHGYRPGHLTNPLGAPLLAWEYFRNKKMISSATTLSFQQALALKQLEDNKKKLFGDSGFSDGTFFERQDLSPKTKIKIASLQWWYRSIGLSM